MFRIANVVAFFGKEGGFELLREVGTRQRGGTTSVNMLGKIAL